MRETGSSSNPERNLPGPGRSRAHSSRILLFLLVPVSSEFFLALMRRDLLAFSFFSAGHVGTPYTESPLSMHNYKKTVKG
jgi:hypothetical protein